MRDGATANAAEEHGYVGEAITDGNEIEREAIRILEFDVLGIFHLESE